MICWRAWPIHQVGIFTIPFVGPLVISYRLIDVLSFHSMTRVSQFQVQATRDKVKERRRRRRKKKRKQVKSNKQKSQNVQLIETRVWTGDSLRANKNQKREKIDARGKRLRDVIIHVTSRRLLPHPPWLPLGSPFSPGRFFCARFLPIAMLNYGAIS